MIRYVSEVEVDVNSMQPSKKHRSQQRSIELASSARVEVPEQDGKSSKALKSLKKANDQSLLLKGRLSVLQIQEEKNQFRAFLNQQRYQFHQNMRDEMERQRQEKDLHLKKLMQRLNQSQEQAKNERLEHEANLKRAQQELLGNKANDYKSTRNKHQEIERNLSEYRREEEERKRQRKEEIKQYEKSQKKNIQEYFNMKKNQFKLQDGQQSMKMSRVTQERKKQIEELSKMESLMLERQARSKMSSEESAIKLRSLLSNKKAVSTSHTTKLPAIGIQKREHSEQDVLLI